MATRFSVTREDMLRSKTVQPGWYNCVIKNVVQAPAKTDSSLNTNVEFVIKDGPNAGVPLKRTFSEKAPGAAVTFIEALLGRPMKQEGEEVDFSLAIGKNIRVYVLNDKYQGRLVNRAEDFQPATN